MRFVPRTLAITTTAALALAGLSVPAYAATSLTCLTSPINNTNRAMVAFKGMDGPLRSQTVTASSSGGGTPVTNGSNPIIADQDGAFEGSLDLTSLGDGTITLEATSGGGGAPFGSTASCTATKSTTPTRPAVTAFPVVNRATEAAAPISGTGEPGASVTVTVTDTANPGNPPLVPATPNTVTKTGVVVALDGTWSTTVDTTDLIQGTLTATATQTDSGNNTSGESAARTTTKDTTAPTATVTSASDVTQASPSTTVSGGGSDTGATYTVTISLGGVSRTATGTTGASGAYSATIDATDVPDGVVNVSTVVRDAAGNNSTAATRTLRKDTEGPFITNLAATDATVASAGKTTVSGKTNDGSTTLSVVVTDRNGASAAATPTPNAMAPGAFSADIDVSSLADGPLELSAVSRDSYGNSGDPASASAQKDTTAPVVAGLSATPTNVADSTTTVAGTTEPGATVALVVEVGSTTRNATATASLTDGAFSAVVDLVGAPDGTVTVRATATDLLGNPGPEATTTTTRDATKPVLTGLRSTDTNAAQKVTTITATTEPGASVLLSATSTGSAMPVSRTVAADGSGAISTTLDLTSLNDGTITVTATPTDTAGNRGDAATAMSTKDTGAPTLTMLNGSDVNAASTVTTVAGTVSEAGADIAISVTDGTTTVTRTLLDVSGTTFSTTLDLATLADKADITVTATATDAGSNTGAAATDTLVKDTVAPTVTTLTATGTSSATPGSTVSGTGEAGTTVAVSITSPGSTAPVTGTATVQPDGTFSVVVDASSLQDGTLTVTATATDAVGNTGAATTATASKDATGPVVATLAATATNAAQTVTTVTGTTEAGAVVTLVAASSGGPATVTDTVTAGSDGAFTKALEVKDLVDGTITVTAVAQDARQNAGPAKTATAGKDTVAPALTGLGATGTTTATPRTTVTGTTDLNQPVTVTVTSGASTATGSATGSATDGTFSVQVDLASFPEGPFTVTISATDAAGNPATASTTASKDTTAPLVTDLAATGTNASSAVSTVTGKAETGASVVVTATDGTRTVTKTVTAAAGAFSTTLDLTGFADGTVTTTARATDTGGNAGAVSSATSTRDTAAPAVTELAATRTSANQQVSTVTGKAETGSSVVVTATDGTRTAMKTVTAAAGAFSTTLDLTGFADGTVTTTARATDSAGNQGATATVTSTRDTVAPTVTGLAATASTNATPGSTVTGTTEGGSSVALTATDSAGKTVTGTATAATGGGFSAVLDLSGLAQGAVTVTAVATDVAGNTGPSATATTSRSANALRFVALTSPVRAMDSRIGTGASTGLKRGAVELDLTSRVPASATGAVLNVTVTQPETGGFVVVYPAGTTQPPTSNVNFAAGQTQANEVVTALSSRKATVFVSGSGRAHLVVDVVGYFTADTGAGGFLTTLAPQRVLGSALARNVGSSSGSSSVDVDLSGALPAGATGAILNVTVASPSQAGFVVAHPTGTADPGTSNVNFAANQVQANEVITRVSADGKVRLTLSRGQARLIVDVVGAIVPSTVAGAKRFTPLPAPVRALDTRSGLGTTGTSRRTTSSPVVLSLPSSVPSDAVGVVLNVTSTGQVGSGFVVAFPTGTAQPGTSNVNFRAGVNQANEVVVGLGTGSNAGKVTLAVGGGTGSPATHLIADVVGYLR